jgi:hypothetical protein
MAKSGAENPQTTEVIPFGVDRRLRPPDRLGDSARRAFVEIVASHAASHFKPSDLTVLCRYAELVALAERSACELERDGVVLADGSLSKWFAVHSAVTKQIGVLAGRLRIGPSSRQHAQSKKQVAPMSFYDRMKLEKDWDKV